MKKNAPWISLLAYMNGNSIPAVPAAPVILVISMLLLPPIVIRSTVRAELGWHGIRKLANANMKTVLIIIAKKGVKPKAIATR